MKILVLDNYDSFTYNLVECLRQLGIKDVDVCRNREITLEKVGDYDKILLSPGPGIPQEAGILMDVIKRYAREKSILGICLGHQAIAQVFGANLENASCVYHGIAAPISIAENQVGVLRDMGSQMMVGRYHSWNVSSENLPSCLQITCKDQEGMIMGIRHNEYDVEGVQFHPESVLTPDGMKILSNWVNKV